MCVFFLKLFQFLDKTLQQELQRIKSSTMRQKKNSQDLPKQEVSFMRTITDRLSDAKVTPLLSSSGTDLLGTVNFSISTDSNNLGCSIFNEQF